MDGQKRPSPLRTFALGGLVGAAGALAAVRQRSTAARRLRHAPAGLAAFEDAPCFLESAGREAKSRRDARGDASRPAGAE